MGVHKIYTAQPKVLRIAVLSSGKVETLKKKKGRIFICEVAFHKL